jgi:hypothetical protein
MNSIIQLMPPTWWVILAIGLLCAVSYLIIYMFHRKLRKIQDSYISLQTYIEGKSLDTLLEEYFNEVKTIRKMLERNTIRLEQTEMKLRSSADRVELIRYNAFDNMGSDLSFSFALLNQDGNGIVLSSINSREESRVYAKPIVSGESSYHLSEEEKKVVEKAKLTIKV